MHQTFTKISAILLFFVTGISGFSSAQNLLGKYEFLGTGTCPNQNPAVTAQPSGATFSPMSNVGGVCVAANNVFNFSGWDPATTVNLSLYDEFTLTATGANVIDLDSIVFSAKVSSDSCYWHLRSSLDGYATDLFMAKSVGPVDTFGYVMPVNFSNLTTVTFRFYVTEVTDNQRTWRIDDLYLKGSIGLASLEELNPLAAELFPNPGTDLIHLSLKNEADDLNVKLFNFKGELISESNFIQSQSVSVNTKDLAPGIYFVALSDGTNTSRFRWVKN